MRLVWDQQEVRRNAKSGKIEGLDTLRSVKGPYVYVIETPPSMAIIYPNGVSCVCYIGRQGVRIQGSRVYAHAKGWIGRHLTLMQSDEVFMIHYSPARQAGVSDAYKDIESYLIRDFQEKFGAPPLFNFSKGKEIYQFPIEDASTLFRRRRLKGVVDGQRGIDIDVKIASGQEP